jgi:hypothetical protein
MEWAALIAWILTALGGSAMFAIWVDKGGLRRGAEPGPRIRPPLIFAHLGIAGTGLVLWIIYLIVDRDWIAWAAFGALVIVVLLGMGMFKAWLQGQRPRAAGREGGAPTDVEPPEQRFPPALVAVHGIAAVVTLVFVVDAI